MDEQKLPLMTHFSDLRKVLIRSSFGIVICMMIAYAFVDHLLFWLKSPILKVMPTGSKLVVLSPAEYFFCELKVAAVFGFVGASPWIFAQFWSFLAPGLYRHEKRLFFILVAQASISFIAGALFARYIFFDPMFSFFVSTLPDDVSGSYSIGTLIGFSLTMLFAFGMVFQTPVVVILAIYSGLIEVSLLKAYRRHVFVLSFIIGAILTPPDPLTQVMLAIPCYLLFEIGILIADLIFKKRKEALLTK